VLCEDLVGVCLSAACQAQDSFDYRSACQRDQGQNYRDGEEHRFFVRAEVWRENPLFKHWIPPPRALLPLVCEIDCTANDAK
jgi:hypothetical protein